MPRKPREEIAGGLYHVFARGNDRQRIFLDDADRLTYLGLLRTVIGQVDWHCLTYCLMENHVHLLIETPQANLGAGMQRLQGAYARSFNRRHRRTGHLWERRYGAKRIEDDAQLWMTIGYIVRNPVASGVCAAPEAWPWSAHAAVLDGSGWVAVDRLLAYVGAHGGDPRRRYEECVGIV